MAEALQEAFVWFRPDLPEGVAELLRTRKAAVVRLMEKGRTFKVERQCGRLLVVELRGLRWID